MGKFYGAALSRIRHGLFYSMDDGRCIAIGPRYATEEELQDFLAQFSRDAGEQLDNPALIAAIYRAERAEAALAEANQRIAELEARRAMLCPECGGSRFDHSRIVMSKINSVPCRNCHGTGAVIEEAATGGGEGE